MSRTTLIAVLAFALMLFLLARGAFYLVCEPLPNNPVVAAVSDAVAPSKPLSVSSQPDPLSWEPVLRSIVSVISKACPK